MPRLHPLIPVLALVASAGPAWAAAPQAPAPATLLEQQAVLPADGPYVVKLTNVRGRVTVRGWNKNVVYVKAVKHASHPVSGTEAELYRTASAVVERPEAGTVAIATRWAGQEKTLPSVLASKTSHVDVDYTLLVPPEVAVQISQEQGPVMVYGTSGRLGVFTRDGEVSVAAAAGRVEAGNERGELKLQDIAGDAVAETLHGMVTVAGVSGDLQARSSTGDVWVTVPPRAALDVSYHTVRGLFRSNLATFKTDMQPDDKGYVGTLRGPLADRQPAEVRYRIDTVSGNLQIANTRANWR